MIALVNTNRMTPVVAPLGLDYVAGAARSAGLEVEILDLCLAEDPEAAARRFFARLNPELVGLTFRNVDDCFWPSARSFVEELAGTVSLIRTLTEAPIVLGGVGFSIFGRRLVDRVGADFGIRGDGEQALIALVGEIRGGEHLERVPGLIWRDAARALANEPAWPRELNVPTARDAIDNVSYFRLGGQAGVETKRGCHRHCIYCADPVAKGPTVRQREPAEVAAEVESLLRQGIDVLHLCDGEFNIPRDHARQVCEALIRRGLGERVRWYAYMSVVPFDADLAAAMRRAGCVGVDFTGDSASDMMLAGYREAHRREDLAAAVGLCREQGITVMIDLILGGPGETPDTLADTLAFMKSIAPDCVGAPLGVRVYPDTPLAGILAAGGPLENVPGIRRAYDGPADLLRPTFYVSPQLGEDPAALVRDLIGGDERFFGPAEGALPGGEDEPQDHNYSNNSALVEAVRHGARGAYWDILRGLRARA